MQGADSATVRRALETGDPLPGTGGFAGELDGALARDVLGRYPLFSDGETWSADPADLDDPRRVPAGHVREDGADRRVWSLPEFSPADDGAVERVREAVLAAVDAVPEDTPVAFSGGLDSSMLAARLDGPLYVAGFEGCHDVAAAQGAADALGREVRVVELTHDDLRRAVPEVARATGRTNAMDVGIALPLYLVAERASADGHDRLAVGQGADELFGGYAKVAKAPDDPRVSADTVRDARRETVLGLPDQLERDVLALRAAGVEPAAPLLHDRVVRAALRLPGDLLVGAAPRAAERSSGQRPRDGDDRRKVALRAAADFLPDEVRERDKKAVQYGTYVARELDRLARRDGFKRRMDDHVTKYVESLLDG